MSQCTYIETALYEWHISFVLKWNQRFH